MSNSKPETSMGGKSDSKEVQVTYVDNDQLENYKFNYVELIIPERAKEAFEYMNATSVELDSTKLKKKKNENKDEKEGFISTKLKTKKKEPKNKEQNNKEARGRDE